MSCKVSIGYLSTSTFDSSINAPVGLRATKNLEDVIFKFSLEAEKC